MSDTRRRRAAEPEFMPVRLKPTSVDEEFADFMAERQGALSRAALLLSGNRAVAEDMTQTALMRTYLAWRRIRSGDPYAYARRILINLRTDHWPRHGREVLTESAHAYAGTTKDHADDVALHLEIVRAFGLLKGMKRRIVVLRVVFDLSEQEVADELGIPVGTVKSATARGLAELRASLEQNRGALAPGSSTRGD